MASSVLPETLCIAPSQSSSTTYLNETFPSHKAQTRAAPFHNTNYHYPSHVNLGHFKNCKLSLRYSIA